MKIGILAFGSLVDDPGDELIKHITKPRIKVETHFMVEYCRSSNGRNGAPTLVPVQEGGSTVQAYILPLLGVSLSKAKNMIYRREINKPGEVSNLYHHTDTPSINKTIIDEHKNIHGFDILLTARLQPNLDEVTPEVLADLAIKSARGNSIVKDRDGITYLWRNISNGIITPLTSSYEQSILDKLNVETLEEAISIMKIKASSS
ncbi:hypothetical protein [Lewinella sp. LCG006]|uniref:hypothetical protein n=1 Tax=Lewinella sp. LCG006 TaxID=3231911 RepID=UPI003460F62A